LQASSRLLPIAESVADPTAPLGRQNSAQPLSTKSSDFAHSRSTKMSRAGSGQSRGDRGRQKGLEEANKVDFGKIVQKEERSVGRVETKTYKVSSQHGPAVHVVRAPPPPPPPPPPTKDTQKTT